MCEFKLLRLLCNHLKGYLTWFEIKECQFKVQDNSLSIAWMKKKNGKKTKQRIRTKRCTVFVRGCANFLDLISPPLFQFSTLMARFKVFSFKLFPFFSSLFVWSPSTLSPAQHKANKKAAHAKIWMPTFVMQTKCMAMHVGGLGACRSVKNRCMETKEVGSRAVKAPVRNTTKNACLLL